MRLLFVERRSSSTSPKKRSKDLNLENVLRRCSSDAVNHESILQLKDVPRGVYCITVALMTLELTLMLTFSTKPDENTTRSLVQRVINSAKAAVCQRFDSKKGKMLETELYLEWLLELEYLVSAVEVRVNPFRHYSLIFTRHCLFTYRQHSTPRYQVHGDE